MLKNCNIASEHIAIAEGIIETIDGGTITGKAESYNGTINAGVINGTRVLNIIGGAKIEGTNLVAVNAGGTNCTVEDGILKSDTPYAICTDNKTGSLTVNGGTFIGTAEPPLKIASGEIFYPFGKTLTETGETTDTYTLDYNAEKIQADTEAALAEITAATDVEIKADLAAQRRKISTLFLTNHAGFGTRKG